MDVGVDAHHHFWDTSSGRFTYPWMTGAAVGLRGTSGPAELAPLLAEAGIDQTLLVQTISSVEETKAFLAIADETAYVGGVVGWVDLTDRAVGEAISRLRDRTDGQWLKGIRHQVHDEADAEWLLRPDVRRGIRAVGEAGLVYDLLVRPRELPATLELVDELSSTRFVVGHIAKPSIAAQELEPWATLMRQLATYDNVSVKLSGMVTEADWETWTRDDLRPYVERLLDWFGPRRLMFGSDWPVCTLAANYQTVHSTASVLMADLSDDERSQIFGRTAVECYQLATGGGAGDQ